MLMLFLLPACPLPGRPLLPPLPEPPALREIPHSGKPVEAEIRVVSITEKNGRAAEVPEFRFGNKSLDFKVREGASLIAVPNGPVITVNGKPVAKLSLWGVNKNGFGYPFKEIDADPPSQETDAQAGTYVFKKPYIASDGKRAVATISAKVDGASKVKLEWSSGSADAVSLWVILDQSRGDCVSFGGKKWENKDKQFLLSRKNFEYAEDVYGDILVSAGAPTGEFKIAFGGGAKGNVTDSYRRDKWSESFGLIYRNSEISGRGGSTSGSATIDFGECYRDESAPPPVGVLDFWELDATHVPLSPVANVMPNPGFEQGLRYWNERRGELWIPGKPQKFEISSDAFEGKSSLLLRDGKYLVSFPLSLKSGRKYTLSFYAKSLGAHTVRASLKSAAKGGNIPGAYGIHGLGDDSADSSFEASKQWRRYSRTFTADCYGIKIFLQARGGDALFDALQLQEGEAPTEFVKAPLEGNLTVSAPGGDLSFGEPIGAQFRVFGAPGTRGVARLSLKNIYYETLFEKNLDVEIGPDGTFSMPLDFDQNKLGQGIFCLRADYAVEGFPPYSDYYRFDVMKKLSNTHATKNIFGTGKAFDVHPSADKLARKFMEWGFGSTNWYDPVAAEDYAAFMKLKEPTTELFRRYRIDNTLFSSHIEATNRAILPQLRKMKRDDFRKKVSPEILKLVERDVKIQLENYPEDLMMCYAPSNEEEQSVRGIFEEYFKVQAAVRKAALEVRPNLKMSPTHGTCRYAKNYPVGVEAINKYMELAVANGFKWDYITVHMYDTYDVDPEDDFDANIAMLKANMDARGHAGVPIQISECGNICDVSIPLWGTRWYDHYSSGRLGYDFNNQEIYQACVFARLYLAALKYYPQVEAVNIWVYYPAFDARMSALLLCKAVNTLGNLYADVRFVGEARPAPGVRAYVFEDRANSGAIAAVWDTSEDVARGRKRAPALLVKFSQAAEFYDINGNPRAGPAADKDGNVRVPLSAAPLSIRAADADGLLKSLKSAAVLPRD